MLIILFSVLFCMLKIFHNKNVIKNVPVIIEQIFIEHTFLYARNGSSPARQTMAHRPMPACHLCLYSLWKKNDFYIFKRFHTSKDD